VGCLLGVVTGLSPHIDLSSGDFYVNARERYTWLRDNDPVHHDAASNLWALSRYDDVKYAGSNPAIFSSAGGSRPETGPLPWMIDLDPPDHHKRRKLVNSGFAPARVRATEVNIAGLCDELIDAVCERGECDFVEDLAARLPLIVIGDMLGIPAADREQLLRWSDGMLASLSGEPEQLDRAARAFGEFAEYALAMMAERKARPTHDLVSVLVHAEVDGDRLTDDEVIYETLLLLVGGDETTRHVMTGGMEQLHRNPDQRRDLQRDLTLLPAAVEEMLRWVSPIKSMARTMTADLELRGRTLPAAEKVVLLYESADFDEAQFPEPDRFDIRRSPNDHVAFGFGAHYCLGASLARLEISTMLQRLFARLPDIECADEPRRFFTSISHMPVRFMPARRSRPVAGT
jgi:cytochrome P450 family 142 subfamily A polypeptide 1